MKIEFKECSICAAKPGSPELCDSCYENRKTFYSMKDEIERLENNCETLREKKRRLHEKHQLVGRAKRQIPTSEEVELQHANRKIEHQEGEIAFLRKTVETLNEEKANLHVMLNKANQMNKRICSDAEKFNQMKRWFK